MMANAREIEARQKAKAPAAPKPKAKANHWESKFWILQKEIKEREEKLAQMNADAVEDAERLTVKYAIYHRKLGVVLGLEGDALERFIHFGGPGYGDYELL